MSNEVTFSISVATLIALIAKFTYLVSRFSKAELKIDTLWDFQMRKAMSEAVNKGMVKMNSPIRLQEKVYQWYSHELVCELKEFYMSVGHKFSERELFIEVEKRFGERIMKEVAIPHDLDSGSSILVAAELAKAS